MNFPPTTSELLEEFEDIQEWDERYDYIIDLGRELPKLDSEHQAEANVVDGCMSTVWLVTKVKDDSKIEILADSDSIIVKGLIVLVMSFYNDKTAAEILTEDPSEFLAQLGLDQHLSPQRRNGLFSMVKRLKQLAALHAA